MADAITHGADTEALRAHALATARGARRLDDLLATLTPLVASCSWEGRDAEAFRTDWHRTAGLMSSAGNRLSEASTTLTEEADQQDRASAPEGLTALLGSSIGRTLAALLGQGGDQLGTGTWWSDLLGHGGDSSTLMGARIAEDDFDQKRGDGSKTTITLPDGSKITLGDDGSQTVKLDGTTTVETEVQTPNGTVTTSVRVGDTMEVTETADGKLKYTFTGLAEFSGSGEFDGKVIGAEGSTSSKVEQVYSVEVPKGTDAAEAMKINPFDPSSIPPGASVTTGTGVEEKSSLSVSGEYRGFELGLGGSVKEGNSQSLKISRDEDTGNLSMLEGPTEMTAHGSTVDLGHGDLKLSMGQETIEKTKVLEYSEFSDDAAGTEAYMRAMNQGMPEDASGAGVEDRYRQTHTSTVIESGFEFGHEDVLTLGRKHEGFSDELIVRDYPDGSQEFAQQILPHGEAENNSVMVEGGTGKQTSYKVTLGDVERTPAMTDLIGDNYGQFQRGDDLSIAMSKDEVSVMADNRAAWHGNPGQYQNEADYLTAMVAADSHHGPRQTVEEMVRDYNYRPVEAGNWHSAERVHPEIEGPGMVVG
ncbi:WXG100 family type VII secretion target [Brachybacterium sp. GCM10030267]|uniref:WXG100 family type VII secretion target n=1 Tax=Brachybacterium sp. GCM10030267 TaxID=3273381 RepID=UPI0036203D92